MNKYILKQKGRMVIMGFFCYCSLAVQNAWAISNCAANTSVTVSCSALNIQNSNLSISIGTALSHSITVSGTPGVWNKPGVTGTSITHYATINASVYGIYNQGNMASIINFGSITGSSQGIYNNASGNTITTLTNAGTITGPTGGIFNAGTITTLNNSQGGGSPLTLSSSHLPLSYGIIINSPSSYGKLSVSGVSGSMAFGIYAGGVAGVSASTVSAGTYTDVLLGFNSLAAVTGTTGSYNGYNYSLVADPSHSGYWNLVLAAAGLTIPTGSTDTTSGLGGSITPVFDGGTLKVNVPGTVTNNFQITSNGGKIDVNGRGSIFSGVISDSSSPAKLTIINTGSGGSVTLANSNTYSGGTEVDAGASLSIASSTALGSGGLALVGSSSIPATLVVTGNTTISNPITVSGDPVFTIASGTTATITSPITDGGAPGDVVADGGGTLKLTAANTYTGATTINSGATLALSAAGSIATSSGVTNNGNFDISSTSSGATIKSLSGSGATALGSQTLSISNGSGTYSGVISDAGGLTNASGGGLRVSGGTETLTGANTYSGATTIESNAALVLSASGSIAHSAALTNQGSFNIVGAANTVNLAGAYTQSDSGHLTMGITPYVSQLLNIGGAASLGGTLSVNATNGLYTPRRYTLLTAAGGVANRFSSLSSNLSSFTRLSYALSYDSNDVYLNLLPSTADTQAALVANASALQGIYALQTGTVNNSLNYDCGYFDKHGFCLSAGGRYSNAVGSHANTTSALLIAAYQLDPHLRLGAYLDQNLYHTDVAAIASLSSNSPLLGLFAVWNQAADQTGLEARLSIGYNNSQLNISRMAIGSSEAATGNTAINTLAESATLGYGFKIASNWMASPYLGFRHTLLAADGYSEQGSAAITSPLTYNGLSQESATALLGLRVRAQVEAHTSLQASAGFEQDLYDRTDQYLANGLAGLAPITFNPDRQSTRATASFGAYYELAKGHQIGLNAIFRQESIQSVDTKMAYLSYTMGF